jgi:hypothetical protein
MRIFKPKGISVGDAVKLERMIELFNFLFQSYRKSVSYILKETGGSEVVMKVLKETDIEITPDVSERMRVALLDICGECDVTDSQLVKMIHMECELQRRTKQQGFKAKPHIWLDCRAENGE